MTQATAPTPRHLRDPVMLLALGFGSGLLPRAPGTWGTVVGVALYAVLLPLGMPAVALFTAMAILAGWPICALAARRLGVHDHPAIVWDEVAGVLVALLFVPAHWPWLIAGFAAFRGFDVLKPWPIGWLDRRVGGGLGIMIDDLVAGLMAGIVLFVIAWLFGLPPTG